jgi:hypothetical protein
VRTFLVLFDTLNTKAQHQTWPRNMQLSRYGFSFGKCCTHSMSALVFWRRSKSAEYTWRRCYRILVQKRGDSTAHFGRIEYLFGEAKECNHSHEDCGLRKKKGRAEGGEGFILPARQAWSRNSVAWRHSRSRSL